MAEVPPWARDPDTLEAMFHAALDQGDTEGVGAALTVMCGCDPRRACRLADELRDALAVARFLHSSPVEMEPEAGRG